MSPILDWLSNNSATIGAIITVLGAGWRLHNCLERRMQQMRQRIGGTDDDPPLSEQIAALSARTQERHEQNRERFAELLRAINGRRRD